MASMSFLINDASTSPGTPTVRVTITENTDGTLTFTVTQEGGIIGDLRGLFFDLKDESLIGSLTTNQAGADFRQGNDSIKDLGDGSNMNGLLGSTAASKVAGAEGNGYDAGIEIGSAGIGKDDIRSYSFTLDSSARDLTLADFSGVDFGVRLTSVGVIGGSRADSSKIMENTFTALDAQGDRASANENDPATTGNVLANDDAGDTASGALSVTGWSGGALGSAINLNNAAGATLQLNADGSYALDASSADALSQGETLEFTFTYNVNQQVDAGDSASDQATFTVSISGKNDGPVADDDTDSTTENDLAVTGNVLAGDTDIDRLDTVSFGSWAGGARTVALDNAAGATLTLGAGGSYTLDASTADRLSEGESLIQSFGYTATDGRATDEAILTVTVNGKNDGPDARDDSAGRILESGTASGNAKGNDSDIDRLDTISVTALNGIADGATGDLNGSAGSIQVRLASGAIVTMNTDGSFTYNTNGAFNYLNNGQSANDSFQYALSDNHGATDTAQVSVGIDGVGSVTPPPPPPVVDPALVFLFNHGTQKNDHGFFPQFPEKDNTAEGFTDNDTLKIAGYGDADSITVSEGDFGLGVESVDDTKFVIVIDGNRNSTRTEDVGYLVDYTGLEADQINVTGNFDEANIFFV